ncbi:adenylate/guanylate cyclase domain-containing protein [Crocinitomix algicola]|uniref:adenylate/guanylate cyclase domain-containing protein n=1 Tax=Crocinitomix algicola TaxID=1740263 RepID=UPI000872F8E8|nr:adenylate/guanylate cyclase domain-containing protein [Crocinitomix algicola]
MHAIKHILIFLLAGVTFGQNANELLDEGILLRKSNKRQKAIQKIEEALEVAMETKAIDIAMECHVNLAELKDNLVNYKEAMDHYRSYFKLFKQQSDQNQKELVTSVNALENSVKDHQQVIANKEFVLDSLTNENLKSELEIRKLELDNQRKKFAAEQDENRRKILLFTVLLFAIVAGFMARSYLRKRRTSILLSEKNKIISEAKEKSDELLLNILPKKVAEELKNSGKTSSSFYENATVMFTDFSGFTKFSEQHSPEELVSIVDFYFSHFDKIIQEHGIEKIKTIGDAYLCVSGIPTELDNHAHKMLDAAKTIIAFVNDTKNEKEKKGEPFLELRIGIHSGPLVAGVVGSIKFAYDVWGDTVNIAARMEQSGQVGRINVSQSVYNMTKDAFEYENRGKLEVKSKGKMAMYFLR